MTCCLKGLISGDPGTLGKTTTRLRVLCFSIRKEHRVEVEQVNENSAHESVLFERALFFSVINGSA